MSNEQDISKYCTRSIREDEMTHDTLSTSL